MRDGVGVGVGGMMEAEEADEVAGIAAEEDAGGTCAMVDALLVCGGGNNCAQFNSERN